MTVLHVDTAVEWRGGQQQLAYLLAARRDRWAGVPGSPLAERIGPPDVALLPGNDPRNAWRLRRALAGVDLVAAHTPHAHGIALVAALGVARVVVHRRVDFVPRHIWKYRHVSGVVAVSHGVARVLERAGLERARIHIVPDGVPLREGPPGAAPDLGELPRPWFVAVGALVDHKGHRHAVEAMRHLPGSLVIAGDGPQRPAVEAQIAALGLSGRVRLLGQLPDVSGLLAVADVFVHPSVEEGMGQAIVEAMGAGCRVAATTAGGIPEVVAGAGELAAPGDAEALAAAMTRALARPKGEGIARAAAFGVDRMVAGTAAAYAAILEGPS